MNETSVEAGEFIPIIHQGWRKQKRNCPFEATLIYRPTAMEVANITESIYLNMRWRICSIQGAKGEEI